MGTKDGPSSNGTGAQWNRETTTSKPRQKGARCTVVGEGRLLEAIEAVTQAGGYFSIGQTSDGGAVVLRILDGDTKMTTYAHTTQELREAIAALQRDYKATWPYEVKLSD